MKSTLLAPLAAFVLMLVPAPGAPAAADPVRAPGLAAALEDRSRAWRAALDSLHVPGFVAAVVQDDSLVWLGAFGHRDLERRLPVDENTMFYIASCTKVFTATLAVAAAARGEVDLDRPVRQMLPRFRLADSAATDTLGLRDLLCHRAGLVSRAITFGEAYTGQMTDERYWRLLAGVEPARDWEYSNLNFTLAARVLDATTGERWQDALERRLFLPAGMERTTCRASRLDTDSNVAIPYERLNGMLRPCRVRKTDRTMHAAGGVAASAADLVRWLRLHLNDGVLDGRRVLPATAVRSMREREVEVIEDHPLVEGQKRVGWGLGWELREHRGARLVVHTGTFDGARALIALLPERRAGVVLLANRGEVVTYLNEAIAAEIYDRVLGLPPADDLARLYAALPRLETSASADTARGRLTRPAADYAGRYGNDDWGDIEVAAERGALTMRAGDLPIEFRLLGDDAFGGDYPGRFVLDRSGRPRSMTLAMSRRDTVTFVRR